MKSVYRHDLTMLAVINLWAQLLLSDRESTVESGDAHTHMDADEATDAFLKESGMTAPAGVGYCLAVRK